MFLSLLEIQQLSGEQHSSSLIGVLDEKKIIACFVSSIDFSVYIKTMAEVNEQFTFFSLAIISSMLK